ncbi:CaiB/BaiF CoA transferase family protein [Gordonia humi]|uniref:Crotonobetainyl-CoA:carnitine CoA-transferase CaiB-like acyl-CoA transferase n=1 Tax=Gordonia humi TaxID=686429 RepID=A0A840EYR3_9ACTN|nr:CoA transferase [Gordonia humi]MBB4134916.1 crotonobetainyl-CoA:carnitine CoA-transferase CaiB-like acyl-CoA transferase [Gordonia humi]
MSPLSDLRVVELGHALAAPFAGSLLGDFGADIIKIEQPEVGDSLRRMGPHLEHSSVWWSVTGRNKRSICIDFKDPDGLAVVHRLIAEADILVENFRPGVLDRSGLGWEELHALNPGLIYLSISGYGHQGPNSSRPGFGKIAEAFSGATHLTGAADATPVHPGYSLGDATTGLMGAYGVMVAVHARETTGQGQHIDLALYESLMRMIEWQVPLRELQGWEVSRTGNQFPFEDAFLTDICRTRDGHNIVISAATSKSLDAVRSLLLTDGVITDPGASPQEMAPALRDWVAARSQTEAMERLREFDVVVGPVHTSTDIVADPHIAARENLVTVADATGTQIPMPNVIPRLADTPGEVRWAGAPLGHQTDEVLRDAAGLSADEIADLRRRRIVS